MLLACHSLNFVFKCVCACNVHCVQATSFEKGFVKIIQEKCQLENTKLASV
jgi:hypothetical protein